MKEKKILVVDDERSIREMLASSAVFGPLNERRLK